MKKRHCEKYDVRKALTERYRNSAVVSKNEKREIFKRINDIVPVNYVNYHCENKTSIYYYYENCDIAIAMSSSRADPVLGLYILSYCPGWGYLNISKNATALVWGI